MRWIMGVLLVLLAYLQVRLWVGDGSLAQQAQLENAIELQQQENGQLRERNAALARDVEALKRGSDAIEEKAREDLGMVKEGETFYMVVESDR